MKCAMVKLYVDVAILCAQWLQMKTSLLASYQVCGSPSLESTYWPRFCLALICGGADCQKRSVYLFSLYLFSLSLVVGAFVCFFFVCFFFVELLIPVQFTQGPTVCGCRCHQSIPVTDNKIAFPSRVKDRC
jgi:hypothetical protein